MNDFYSTKIDKKWIISVQQKTETEKYHSILSVASEQVLDASA